MASCRSSPFPAVQALASVEPIHTNLVNQVFISLPFFESVRKDMKRTMPKVTQNRPAPRIFYVTPRSEVKLIRFPGRVDKPYATTPVGVREVGST
jgi:hypothetical protein